MKKAIAMFCKQDQFEKIREKINNSGLEIIDVTDLDIRPYLVNNFNFKKQIGTVKKYKGWRKDYEIHETWNEKVFLEACGIEIEPEFVITKEQILHLSDIDEIVSNNLEKWFPDVFKEKKFELEVGKWIKSQFIFIYITKIDSRGKVYGYGWDLCSGIWYDDCVDDWGVEGAVYATPEEVNEALTKEAVKRGFVEGIWLKRIGINESFPQDLCICGEFDYLPLSNVLDDGHGFGRIFKNGKWAEIIPIITKEDAEKELGKKILN